MLTTLQLRTPPAPQGGLQNGALHLTVRSIKTTLVVDAGQLIEVDPSATNGQAHVTAMIALEGQTGQLRTKFNARSLRKALATIAEHGAEQVVCVVSGRLVGDEIIDAGISVSPKAPPAAP